MGKEMDGRVGRQLHSLTKETDGQNGQTDGQRDGRTDGRTDHRRSHGQMDRRTERGMGGRADRWADGRTDRWTDSRGTHAGLLAGLGIGADAVLGGFAGAALVDGELTDWGGRGREGAWLDACPTHKLPPSQSLHGPTPLMEPMAARWFPGGWGLCSSHAHFWAGPFSAGGGGASCNTWGGASVPPPTTSPSHPHPHRVPIQGMDTTPPLSLSCPHCMAVPVSISLPSPRPPPPILTPMPTPPILIPNPLPVSQPSPPHHYPPPHPTSPHPIPIPTASSSHIIPHPTCPHPFPTPSHPHPPPYPHPTHRCSTAPVYAARPAASRTHCSKQGG